MVCGLLFSIVDEDTVATPENPFSFSKFTKTGKSDSSQSLQQQQSTETTNQLRTSSSSTITDSLGLTKTSSDCSLSDSDDDFGNHKTSQLPSLSSFDVEDTDKSGVIFEVLTGLSKEDLIEKIKEVRT